MGNFLKNNWLIILILLLVIYLAYKYYLKIQADNLAQSNLNQVNNNGVLSTVHSAGTTTVVTSNPTQPVTTPVSSGYKVGDKIYAGSTGVNIHDTPSVSSASVIKFYGKDDYIGTFVGFQSVPSVPNDQFVKIIVNQASNSFLDAFGFSTNAVRFALSKQVYSK